MKQAYNIMLKWRYQWFGTADFYKLIIDAFFAYHDTWQFKNIHVYARWLPNWGDH